ncbi:regulator of G-protein signaling 18 [Pangasianodon hypophthalmus]|uniref:regulator of G-protein signaling 18 n=1 Tax=Pangasianodon hypophthalmus TaxID=310915 RepID=UPI000EFDEA37|nr:regulator of G-protein signaling 18 [Pangasianodon hypophthalmus]
MRRFSSEGSLLGLDIFPWKSVSQKNDRSDNVDGSSTCKTLPCQGNKVDHGAASLPATPAALQDPVSSSAKELSKELSFSVEDLTELDIPSGMLKVTNLNESFKAYSDSQLAPHAISNGESVEKDDVPSLCPSSTSTLNPVCFNSGSGTHQNRHHVRAKLSSAKLHLKSLFGQSPHSSNPSVTVPEPRDRESSAKQRRSRFTKQWSQVGHAKTRLSRAELEKWAESLDVILNSRVAVSVFGAFLRSEFSEENLQFYLACEQYRQSSNTFSLGRRAKEITATYIQPGAPREVNLDSKTRELTLQLLKAPSHNSLCHAQKRIRALLEYDCYPRFLQSNIYLTLLQDAH